MGWTGPGLVPSCASALAATASATARKVERVRTSATTRSRGMHPVTCLRFGRQRSTVPSRNPESGSSQHSKRRTSRSSTGGNWNRPSKHGPCSGARGRAAPRKRGRQPAPVGARSRAAPLERGPLGPPHPGSRGPHRRDQVRVSRASFPAFQPAGNRAGRGGQAAWLAHRAPANAIGRYSYIDRRWHRGVFVQRSLGDRSNGGFRGRLGRRELAGSQSAGTVRPRQRLNAMAVPTGRLSRIARKASCNDY